jgi:aminopeptidase YwaD
VTRERLIGAGVLAALLSAGCTGGSPATVPSTPAEPARPASRSTTPEPGTASVTPSPSRGSTVQTGSSVVAVRPEDFRVGTAVRVVRHLAGRVGPRPGTSPAYRQAARWVGRRLQAMGYDVRRQRFSVPGGTSWGVPVAAGRSVNLVAAEPGLDPERPHVVVGAHLDTVPLAPGAEDNASGVGVLLAAADALAERRSRLPVRFVVFGAEEPRGPGDDDHHYGSRHYVAQLSAAERRALRGMVSLDRVGVGTVLPVCSAVAGPTPLRRALMRAADRARVPVEPCAGNRASDHWSFVRNGLPGARLGSTPYAGYHSPQDVPAVVGPDQLGRAGRTVLAWLSPR